MEQQPLLLHPRVSMKVGSLVSMEGLHIDDPVYYGIVIGIGTHTWPQLSAGAAFDTTPYETAIVQAPEYPVHGMFEGGRRGGDDTDTIRTLPTMILGLLS